jgi:GNAT superfamily N-acetyltransferase
MLQIRQCSIEDFEEVVKLLGQLWPDKTIDTAALQTVFARSVASECQVYLCAADDNRIIGFASLTIKNSLWQEGYLGHVDELIVDAEHRGRGVGTQLLDHLVAMARQRGCRRVELDSAFHREQAHQFYERQGFVNRAFLFSRVL